MNRTHQHGDLPDPVRRYWMELGRADPPMDLLDEVVAEIEKAPRPLRFSFLPVAGVLAAASVAIAVLTLNLWPASPQVGSDGLAPATSSQPAASPSASLPPGVVPVRDDPPLSTVPVLEAAISEWNVDGGGSPVLAAHGSVWFGNSETGQLTRVDVDTGEVSDVIDVNPNPSTPDWNLVATADDRWVYAVGLDETIVQIDPATNEMVQRIPVGVVPYRLEVHDGNVYVTDLDRMVTRVDVEAGSVVWQVRAGVQPAGLEITDDAVWVAMYGDNVLLRLAPATGEVLDQYPVYLHGTEIVHDGGDALFITGGRDSRPMERFSISEGQITDRIEEMIGPVIHDGHLYGLRGRGQLLVLLDPSTLEWQAFRETGTVDGGMVVGEGAVWVYVTGRLLSIQPSP